MKKRIFRINKRGITIKIDQIDVKILNALLKDARCKFSEIANDCGVTTSNIVQRVHKMKQAGVITGTVLRLNMKKFNKNYVVIIDIDVEHKEVNNIIQFLNKIPSIVITHKLLGKHDIHASFLTESLEEIDQIRDLVNTQKGVIKVWISNSLDETGMLPENIVITPTETETSG